MSEIRQSIFQPGAFFGNCRIKRLVGKGGVAEVYLACGRDGKSRYAIKVLRPHIARREKSNLRRFIYEAEFAMSISHPNLVAVHDAGVDPDTGLFFMMMEYMDGGTLRDFLNRKKRISLRDVILISLNIAQGLAALNTRGIVHRDVKPENILFTAEGVAKLTDFGVSSFCAASPFSLTMADAMLGTPAYMSLEQMIDSHEVDERSDIYSLGVVMYEMLAGRRPNENESTVSLFAKALGGGDSFCRQGTTNGF